MSANERRVALAAVAIVVAGHLLCLALGAKEAWPFSAYPMYSHPAAAAFSERYLVGVAEDGAVVELWRDFAYTRPLYNGSLQRSFERLAKRDGGLEAAARDCLRRYDDARRRGLHNGPALAAMRVVERSWRLDSRRPDLVDSARRPDAERILVEVRR